MHRPIDSKKIIIVPLLSILAFVSFISPGVALSSVDMTKRILVTGGNKGIGRAICRTLLEQYPHVHVIMGSRDKARGEKAVSELLQETTASNAESRLECLLLDTSSDDSVQSAASKVTGPLYGIVNNAGIGFGNGFEKTLDTNYFGPRRVNDAFSKLLQRPGGRIVNIASASGPNFVSKCADAELKKKLSYPRDHFPMDKSGIETLDTMVKSYWGQTDYENDAYGVSKAFLNAYTTLHAGSEPDLIVNSCTPGYIATDLTKGMGATNPPSKGAVTPVHLLMSDELTKVPTGRYYGSDSIRSPLHVYRGPGDPPYEGP